MGGASVLALALAVAPQVASAQAADPALDDASIANIDEVVVTARKRSERLRDVPTAGTALGIEAIREMGGVPTAQSLLSNTPGVNFANTSNPVTSEVSIRGSGTSRATNASAGVGLYRDGAYSISSMWSGSRCCGGCRAASTAATLSAAR